MRINLILFVLAVALFSAACSNEPEPMKTIVKGQITVADSIDSSGDYSGIGITVVNRDSANADADTLFHQTTDRDGTFEGEVTFPAKRYYSMILSRNERNLGTMRVILANNDTLTVNMTLPDIRNTLNLSSREHDAMKTYIRIDRNFQRVGALIGRGAVPDSQLYDELAKWSDLYWEVYESNPNTMASYLAAEKAVTVLNSLDKEKMMDRIDYALPSEYMIPVALRLGKPFVAQSKGFEAASQYLDSLALITEDERSREMIRQDKIMMYFDSSRIKEAKQLLTSYEGNYADNSASRQWARRIRYDLNYLAPGVKLPEFSFTTLEGDTVNNSKLNGDVFILEISPLANATYQNDYDRTLVINEIYKNYGLKIFTIPLDQSEVTVNAFFDERRKAWPVAQLGSFNVQEMVEKFNVVQIPTRFLIDENGVIIRKYERDEFDDVIEGLNKAFGNKNSPS